MFPVPRIVTSIALVCAAAFGVAGCSNSPLFDRDSYSNMFSKKVDWFTTPEWAKASRSGVSSNLGPSGPVAPEDLVAADGRCAPKAEPAPAPTPPPAATPQAAAPLPDRLEPGMPAAAPATVGGVALGMSECDVVRRAGQPSNVSVGAGEKGERKVVLSYLGGTWAGIYQFRSGRLKEIEAAPEQAKPTKTKKKRVAPKTAHGGARMYVQ